MADQLYGTGAGKTSPFWSITMLNPELGSFHKDQLLSVLFNYMGQDLRQKLMLECPAAYNAACGQDVVRVVRSEDGTPIILGEYRITRVALGGEVQSRS